MVEIIQFPSVPSVDKRSDPKYDEKDITWHEIKMREIKLKLELLRLKLAELKVSHLDFLQYLTLDK